MYREFINIFPTWQIFLLISLLFVGFSLVMFYLFSYLLPCFKEEEAESMGMLVGFLGGAFGVLLGFIIVNLWQSLELARTTVSEEARAFDSIIIDSAVFPVQARKNILNAVQKYICALTIDERKTMRSGYTSKKAVADILNLFAVVQSYKPETEIQKMLYSQTLYNLKDALKARRQRADYINSRLPPEIHFILILGAFLVVGSISILQSAYKSHRGLRVMMLVFASIGIACNLGMALALDYPFSGSINVSFMPFTSEGALIPFAKCPIKPQSQKDSSFYDTSQKMIKTEKSSPMYPQF